jgi:MSHA biogenesis protein MshO
MMRQRGFTLVELVVTLVITGILASTLTMFLQPVINGYFDTRRRADLADAADTALRRIAMDIHRAVPNSIVPVSSNCIQLVPSVSGGRYRVAPDATASGSDWLDIGAEEAAVGINTGFDVLSPMASLPEAGDWVVIGNQATADVYGGASRESISAVGGSNAFRRHHLRLSSRKQFPLGYDGGRFVVVANAEQSVFYSCSGRVLYRTVAAFGANRADTCASVAGAVLAADVEGCTFVYDPNQGATQQAGFVWMRLELRRDNEGVALVQGVHVDNEP